MMTLREARCAFTQCLCWLVTYGISQGYEMAFGEVQDTVTAKDPTTDHMKGSLHEIGLAADINLYRDGKYLELTEDHQTLGEYWEELGKINKLPLRWGGRFRDGNHYSLEWLGIK